MKSIECIFFDFGGVLADEGFAAGLRVIADNNGIDEKAFFDGVREVIFNNGYVVGKCDEPTFWKDVRSKFGVTGTDKDLRNEILSRFILRPWMMSVVEQCKQQGITVAILSDQVNWLDELDERYGFSDEFEHVFNSYNYGAHKGQDEYFHMALEKMGKSAEQCLLVDDAVVNVETARRVGLETILFTDRKEFEKDFSALFPWVNID